MFGGLWGYGLVRHIEHRRNVDIVLSYGHIVGRWNIWLLNMWGHGGAVLSQSTGFCRRNKGFVCCTVRRVAVGEHLLLVAVVVGMMEAADCMVVEVVGSCIEVVGVLVVVVDR